MVTVPKERQCRRGCPRPVATDADGRPMPHGECAECYRAGEIGAAYFDQLRAHHVRAEGGEPLIVSGDTTQQQPTNPPADPPAPTTPPEPATPPVDPAAIAAMVAEQVAAQMAEQQAAELAAAQQTAIAAYLEANPPGRPAPSNTPPPAAPPAAGDPQAGADAPPRHPEKPVDVGGSVPAKPVKWDGVDEIVSAMVNASDDIKAQVKDPRPFWNLDLRVSPADVMAATLVDIGPVQTRDRTRVAVTALPRAIDYLPMRPVVGNAVVVPVMQDDTSQTGNTPLRTLNALDTQTELTINVPAYIYPVQNLIASHPVAKANIEDDPTIVGAEVRRLLRLGQQVLDNQVLDGDATINFATGAITAAGNDLVGLKTLAGTRSIAVASATSSILDGNGGVETVVSSLLANVMPNLGIMDAQSWAHLWASLRGTFYPLAGINQRMIDYIGTAYILDSLVPSNTAFIGEFVEENHYIAMRRDFRIEMSDDEEFSRDNVVFKLTMRAANCIANPNALIELTATNNFTSHVPMVSTP